MGKRILIVEDNVDAARSLEQLLLLEGHTVGVAHDAEAGLALAKEFIPEVAIVDIGLPNMDGHEFGRRFRQMPGGASCLLIAATAYGRPEDITRSTEAGFDAHFVKPVPLLRLLKAIGDG
jgi:CheY-like chemotaxis protein